MSTTPGKTKPIVAPTSSTNVIFLIGAGISTAFGIPAMRGMYAAFLDRKRSGITLAEKKICKIFTQDLGVDPDLEEFLLATNNVSEFVGSNIATFTEKAVSRTKKSPRIREYRERLADQAESIFELRTKILDFMSKTCFKFDRSRSSEILGPFVSALAGKGYAVFTTNYDPAMEYVATEQHLTVHDNFFRHGQQELWNSKIHFPLGDGLTLVKLHGSVTWYVNHDHDMEKIIFDTNISPLGDQVERVVIVPTRFKDIYAQHFFALYSRFLAALAETKTLVVIGHSLRDDYLRAAIIERFRKDGLQMIVIDPTFPRQLPPEMKPSRRSEGCAVKHVPMKFEEFSDELASLIAKSAPEELADECMAVVHHAKSKTNKIKIKGNINILKTGSAKRLTAIVDAYLARADRPSTLRIWLSCIYNLPDGIVRNEVSGDFIEQASISIATALSGMVQEEFEMNFTIPKYKNWVAHAAKVTLHVGIVRASVKEPAHIRGNLCVAEDSRTLTYRAEKGAEKLAV